jgi:hypothetical protein
MLWYHSQTNIQPTIEILGPTPEAMVPDPHQIEVPHDSPIVLVQTAILAPPVTIIVIAVVGAVGVGGQGSYKALSMASLGWLTTVISPARHDNTH